MTTPTTTKRFFVETYDDDKAASPIIPPGERRVFIARCFEPVQLAGVQAFADDAGALALREVRVGEHAHKMNERLGAPVDVRDRRIAAAIAQRMLLFVENTGPKPLSTKVACLTFSLERGAASVTGTAPCHAPRSHRKFEVPAKARGFEIKHVATAVLRPMRMRIVQDGQMELEIDDVKVGNRSQMASGHSVPVEFYADWKDVHFDTVATEQTMRFILSNSGNKSRTVEIELEAYFADETPPELPGLETEFPIAFLHGPVDPGATAEISVTPEVAFRGERLVMVTHEGLNVVDLRVGKQSQLQGSGLPARVFAPEENGWPLNLDETTAGVPVTLVVKNVGDCALHSVQAMLVGKGKDKVGQLPLPPPSEAARAKALELIAHTPAFGALARSIDRGMRIGS